MYKAAWIQITRVHPVLEKTSETGSALTKYRCLGTQNTRKNYEEEEITLSPFLREGENARKLLILFPGLR